MEDVKGFFESNTIRSGLLLGIITALHMVHIDTYLLAFDPHIADSIYNVLVAGLAGLVIYFRKVATARIGTRGDDSPGTKGVIPMLLLMGMLAMSMAACEPIGTEPGGTLTAQDAAIQRVVRIQQVYLPLKAVLVSGVNSGEIKGNSAKAVQSAIAVFDAELNAATEAAKAGTSTTAQLDALQRSLDNFQFNNPPPTPTTQPAK